MPWLRPPSWTARGALFRAIPTLALAALVLAVEGGVRLFSAPLPALDVLVAAPDQLLQLVGRQDTAARRDRPRLFEADARLFWRLKANVAPMVWNQTLVATNAQGLRHPRPIGPKPPGASRVVCLGDSVTFGFRVPLATADAPVPLRPGEPYPRRLEERLRRRSGAVEVIAMAVPGYSSHQGRAWAAHRLAALAPDVVIVCFGWNDVSEMPLPDHDALRMDAPRVWARGVLIHSQAALHAAHAWRGTPAAAPSAVAARGVARVPHERYVANIRAIIAEARALDARVLVLSPVYRDAVTVPDEAARMARHRAALAEAMTADGVPHLVVPELTEAGAAHNADLFVEHIHPNEAGHERLAAALEAEIETRGLLPPR